MIDYSHVAEFIERNRDVVDFGDRDDGVSQDWIARAEHELGVLLPPSYRWWLQNYRGGEVCGEEIFSVYEIEFDAISGGGDIVYMYRVHQKSKQFKPYEIVICSSDIDGSFFLDTSSPDSDSECPVKSSVTGGVYARNFAEFLLERISACGGAA